MPARGPLGNSNAAGHERRGRTRPRFDRTNRCGGCVGCVGLSLAGRKENELAATRLREVAPQRGAGGELGHAPPSRIFPAEGVPARGTRSRQSANATPPLAQPASTSMILSPAAVTSRSDGQVATKVIMPVWNVQYPTWGGCSAPVAVPRRLAISCPCPRHPRRSIAQGINELAQQ